MKKNFVYIFAAIIAIALAVGLFAFYQIQNKPADPEPTAEKQSVEPVAMTNTVVASQVVPAGTVIQSSMLKIASVPVNCVPDHAISDIKSWIGATALVTIEKETVIETTMLELPSEFIADSDGLSYTIPDGFVAIAVEATGLNGVVGYLLPGDVVSILANRTSVKAAMNGTTFEALAEYMVDGKVFLAKNVSILAVGNKSYDELMAMGASLPDHQAEITIKTGNSEEGTESSDTSTYDCVVFAVDELTAQLIVDTMQTSPLTLVLQHRGYDGNVITVPEIIPIQE